MRMLNCESLIVAGASQSHQGTIRGLNSWHMLPGCGNHPGLTDAWADRTRSGRLAFFWYDSAFIKASEILEKIDKKKYQPVIILLTDGQDCNKNNTIKFIRKVSYYLILII